MHSRLTKLDAQLKAQMSRIIEHRNDGLTFHYKAIDQVRADGQQLVNQAMGGILQDSINEMGRRRFLKAAVTRCRGSSAALAACKRPFRMNGKTRKPISSSLVRMSAVAWSPLRRAAKRWWGR